MNDTESADQHGDNPSSSTSPDAPHPGEATQPPSNPQTDDQAVQESEDKLDQAGGGH